jgi:hypothetical protein
MSRSGFNISVGFKKGDITEFHIEGTSSAAFKPLFQYLYTDSMEVDDDAVLFDLTSLCDQYWVERLLNHCLHQICNGLIVENAGMRLVQAHSANSGVSPMWAKLESKIMRYTTRNFEEIWCNARASLELLDREQFKQMLIMKCGLQELMML